MGECLGKGCNLLGSAYFEHFQVGRTAFTHYGFLHASGNWNMSYGLVALK